MSGDMVVHGSELKGIQCMVVGSRGDIGSMMDEVVSSETISGIRGF
jgi:hypothetical protein